MNKLEIKICICFNYSAVCDVRLDFEQFTTNAVSLTTEANGGLCQDVLTITTNTGQSIPEICGTNSGQHGNAFTFYSGSRSMVHSVIQRSWKDGLKREN